jgi:4-alpha-glucanotransferase
MDKWHFSKIISIFASETMLYSCPMKLRFKINYNTSWGTSVRVYLSYYDSEEHVVGSSYVPMNTDDGSIWRVETAVVETRQKNISFISYQYVICGDDGNVIRKEWNLVPRKYYVDISKDYDFPDYWRDIPLQYHLYTQAYATTVRHDGLDQLTMGRIPVFRKTIVFRVSAPQLKNNESLAIVGNHPVFGNWNTTRFLEMNYCGQYEWILAINVDNVELPLEYKYVVVDSKSKSFIAWEGGDNRTTGDYERVDDGQVLVFYGDLLRVSETRWKIAGVVIPVFSLRSEYSYGVGDFGDLHRMIDWVASVGMKAIQLLPVNDTTATHHWTDSYPYNTISIYALHPHYMNLDALGIIENKEMSTTFNRQRHELNASDSCDYEAVDKVKNAYIKAIYKENGLRVLTSSDFKKFLTDNEHWLKPYAAFCVLRERYKTAHFSDWKELSVYDEPSVNKMCEVDSMCYDEICFIFYVQYMLHKQLLEDTEYARSKGVILKGDLPIGISRDSVEAWKEPHYFNMDSQTGAPPDAFSYQGQNWNFPTYNWEIMLGDGCRWWKQRFKNMEQYFDAFRIDHILGFFRIWEIPGNAVHGLLGHFSPSLPLSVGEIEFYGLPFRKELFTQPFINDTVLKKYFGIHDSYVREHFLKKRSYDMYNLLPEYDTQIKVRDYFNGKNDENSLWIRDGLYRLISDVLFLEDPKQHEMYHPRIGVYQESVYNALNYDEKDAFMRLYNNYYYERHNEFWRNEAMRKLPLILNDIRMLVCGEDLGMLPDCVDSVLDSLKILSLEIQTMPKKSGCEFAHLDGNPYRSVATISTHDMPPLRLWWEENYERTQRFYTMMLQKIGKAPQQLPASLAEEIIARHLYSPSMLCMLSFQDWTSMNSELRSKKLHAERINVPSDPYNYWCYRMHITIENLLTQDKFNNKLKQMIKLSHR